MNYPNSQKKFFLVIILTIFSMVTCFAEDTTKSKSHKPPILTTTAIIEIYEKDEFQGIVLIERGKAPFGKAIPGGKVEYGETVEDAVRREMLEEVHLELEDLKQFHVYSEPSRDFRHHSIEVAHVAKSYEMPLAGDDAANAFLVKLEDIPWKELAFDHAQVLQDYIKWRNHNDFSAMEKP